MISITIGKTLNPLFWDGMILKPEIREKLLDIAKHFVEYLDIPNESIKDVTFTGSMANFHYGEKSDIFRYEILQRYVGVYLDIDFVLIKPLDILHHSYDYYACLMPISDCQGVLANGLIGAVTGHPLINDCVDGLPARWAIYEKTSFSRLKNIVQ